MLDCVEASALAMSGGSSLLADHRTLRITQAAWAALTVKPALDSQFTQHGMQRIIRRQSETLGYAGVTDRGGAQPLDQPPNRIEHRCHAPPFRRRT